ncbi:uncharacterized protein LOC131538698 [Onychostoma macrolepis]|uniref:uncharacterized protein LOC131538698 n=1 Tax=Onychostoma macrolepis TaxID=369639 RepID=UPI00272A0A5E|nr:uncharacterized protein LOC131538698 [Onychostoma macrolepis]
MFPTCDCVCVCVCVREKVLCVMIYLNSEFSLRRRVEGFIHYECLRETLSPGLSYSNTGAPEQQVSATLNQAQTISTLLKRPRLCCGFLIRRGGLLLYPLHRGGLRVRLPRSGGLLLHLFRLLRCGGPLSGSGGLLLCPRGLLLYLCRRVGLLSGSGGLLLLPGGLQSHRLLPGGLQSRRLRPGGLQSRLLHPGGLQSCLLRPAGLQSCPLCSGFLLCRLCLGPRSLRFHKDLALHPSPCAASAPPPSWIIDYVERLEAALWGGALSRIWSVLPFIHHQRSPVHHIDSHTIHNTGHHFPSFIALIAHTADCTNHTHT